MKQEDKDLLLRDICARLPYVVFMGNKEWKRRKYQLTTNDLEYAMMTDDWENIPYLRPMSSITEEELSEYRALCRYHNITGTIIYEDTYKSFDWLNAHHFDYRGLIEKGLAIEVTEENNPYKE